MRQSKLLTTIDFTGVTIYPSPRSNWLNRKLEWATEGWVIVAPGKLYPESLEYSPICLAHSMCPVNFSHLIVILYFMPCIFMGEYPHTNKLSLMQKNIYIYILHYCLTENCGLIFTLVFLLSSAIKRSGRNNTKRLGDLRKQIQTTN